MCFLVHNGSHAKKKHDYKRQNITLLLLYTLVERQHAYPSVLCKLVYVLKAWQ